MANKEATVMVLDVGRTMWHSLDVDGKTHLDNACTAIAHILHSKITQGRKTDLVAIVLVGTDGTKNALNEKIKTQYKHITTYVDIGMASLDTFKYVTNGCEKGSGSGDIIDGIVVAITMLEKHCKHLKWVKSIFVFSDFSTEIDTDDDNKIISKAVDYGVKINLIGFGFKDDPPPESDTSIRATNERFMRSFCSATDGDIFSATEALALLGELRSRTVRPTTLIRTTMYLGEPENSGSFGFQVWAYAKVKEAKLPSGKKWSRIGAEAVDVVDEFTRGEVAMERTYKVKDLVHTEDGENGDVAEPVELNKEDLIRAYKYGKDLIPFAEEDRDAMKLQTEKGFSIIGFVKNAEISREIFINDPMQIIPDPGATGNSKNMFEVLALSLKTKDVCALVRYVRIKDAPPKIGVLIPHIGKRIWCAWIQIPFKEDVREYAFTTLAPLLLDPGASTTQSQSFSESSSASLATTALNYGGLSSTGESKRKKMNFRTVDSAEADRRIDQFIDDMDLSTAIVDDDGEKFEAYKSIDIFNPGYQRIYQCIAYRVMNPGEKKLPPLDPRFVAGVLPMPELVEKAKRSFELVKDSFSIIKIETDKEDNRKRFKKGVDNAEDIERDVISAAAASAANINPTSDVTTFSFVSGSTVTSVGSAEPVADFAALLSRGDPVVSTAAMNQLAARVVAFVRESLGAQFYPKAISCIVALRRESIARKECIRYNDLLVELKALTADNSDQIQCKPFWAALKKESNTVGLITKQDVSESAFNVEEAAEFFETAALPASIIELEPVEEDDQDLIDMLD